MVPFRYVRCLPELRAPLPVRVRSLPTHALYVHQHSITSEEKDEHTRSNISGIRLMGKERLRAWGKRLAGWQSARVTSYGPFRGLKGTIKTVDTIIADFEDPFCFYLVALDGAYIKEHNWFEYHEVEGIDPLDASLHKRDWLISTSE